MNEQLQGKTALVTGASGGIGGAIAQRLARDGARVAVHFSGSRNKAEEVVTAIKSSGGKALALQADIARVEDIRHLFEQTVEAFGRLNIVVNNAGIGTMAPVESQSERGLREGLRCQCAWCLVLVSGSSSAAGGWRAHRQHLVVAVNRARSRA
jgi:NAD(P)-dependent dehydrogenase (short-subunit alcohol dehydrogenase family)